MFDSAELEVPALAQVLTRREMSVLVLYLKQQQLSDDRDFPEVLANVAERLSEVLAAPNFSGLFVEVSPWFIWVFQPLMATNIVSNLSTSALRG